MIASNGIALVLVLATASTASAGSVPPELREKAQAACYDDASRLCPDALVDETQVVACMRGKRALLTAPCRTVFDEVIQATK